jgi:hypothetical protein
VLLQLEVVVLKLGLVDLANLIEVFLGLCAVLDHKDVDEILLELL